ncbi:MAG TPA: bifunctional precorrin-2 dehydrogenase/sirohydrochlorin ferrochelatase [Tepidisphaeraceae bacterium]|nr:bifunctional precorrin-2 dehydrogenase/sirohydrochlorin ferrochelatase [Tepidisphaeraceae bacterium]
MAYSYPILLDLMGKLVVIVGGGKVAVRKARGLIEGGATRIKCIAPEFEEDMPREVETVEASFQPSQLDGATLVFAATDSPQVNFDVVRAANQRKIMVSRVDSDEDHGDFVLPANWRNGHVLVSISTGSPALSSALRDEIKANFRSMRRYEQMAELLQSLRPWLMNSSLETSRRIDALFELATKPALDVLAQSGSEGLYRWLVERYPELKLEKAP